MCSLTVMTPKVVGATSLAKRGEKSTELPLAQFTPSNAVRGVFRLRLCRRHTRMVGCFCC